VHHSVIALFAISSITCVAQPQGPGNIKDFIRVQSPVIALEHVRVIDGTGAQPQPDQTIVISGGKITAIGKAATVGVPADAKQSEMKTQPVTFRWLS